jgi:cell division protein FtsB
MQKEEERCLAILKDLKEKNRLLADEIRRLREDNNYFESVAREQLGMIKDNEIVYRFKKELKNAKKGK